MTSAGSSGPVTWSSSGALAPVAGLAQPPDDRGLLGRRLRMVDQTRQMLVILFGRQIEFVGDRLRLRPRGAPPARLERQNPLFEAGESRLRFAGGADGPRACRCIIAVERHDRS